MKTASIVIGICLSVAAMAGTVFANRICFCVNTPQTSCVERASGEITLRNQSTGAMTGPFFLQDGCLGPEEIGATPGTDYFWTFHSKRYRVKDENNNYIREWFNPTVGDATGVIEVIHK
jgi:hypothetical protein